MKYAERSVSNGTKTTSNVVMNFHCHMAVPNVPKDYLSYRMV